ncbi:hypothetical protein cyc_03635 [Cyclospora cayetanensis]|uniref:Uncharacterized protein n=1 Tax=Cyclospora cayetanensis TaxID=88456 RepID=A0A1D3D877_9EIME|nr:hypothetical protein cyc_03635 [Cyclospora cayetanensis]
MMSSSAQSEIPNGIRQLNGSPDESPDALVPACAVASSLPRAPPTAGGAVPAMQLIPPPTSTNSTKVFPTAAYQDEDEDCLLRLPPVRPAGEPDYAELSFAMRKAWESPLVQQHLEHSMHRDELLHVWNEKKSHSPGGNYFFWRHSPRGHHASSSQGHSAPPWTTTTAKDEGSASIIKPFGKEKDLSKATNPKNLPGHWSQSLEQCFLEFQAIGAELLTTQVILQEKADSYLVGSGDPLVVQRAGEMLLHHVKDAESIRDSLRAIYLRWEGKGDKLLFCNNEMMNAMYFVSLKRLVKAAVYAHREMSAFANFAICSALNEKREAKSALAEGAESRAHRANVLNKVAQEDLIPFEVYLVFAPPVVPLLLRGRSLSGPRRRPPPSERFTQGITYTAVTAPASPCQREREARKREDLEGDVQTHISLYEGGRWGNV